MDQKKRPFFTLFEMSDLIILCCYVFLAVTLIAKVFTDGWEKLSLLLILLSLIFSWYVHFSRIMRQDYRILVYTFCMLGSFIYYGLHASSLFNMAPVIILFMLVLSLSGKRALIYFSVFIYVALALLDYFVLFREEYAADKEASTRLLFHFLLVFFAALIAGIFVYRIKLERARFERYVDNLNVAEERANETIRNVSLEMEHPANAISGETMLLQKENLSEEAKEEILSLHIQGEKLRSQISDLSDFIEIVNHTAKVNESVYSVFDLLDALKEESRARLADTNVEPVLDLDPLLPQSLIGDGEKVKKILKQLIINAFRFTKEGCVRTRIFLNTHRVFTNLCIEVSDTGIGMEQSWLERVKSRIARFLVCDYRPGGMGIGLSIVYGYARVLGGFVTIRSSFGNGTSVHVSIPQKVANAVPAASYNKKSGVYAGWVLEEDKIKNPRFRRYIMKMLERITKKTGAPMYQVRNEEDLNALKARSRKVCLFVPRNLYEEQKAYYDSLRPEVYLVLVEYRMGMEVSDEVRVPGEMTLIRQPFSAITILRCMEQAAQASKNKRAGDREVRPDPGRELPPLPPPLRFQVEKREVLLATDSMCDLPADVIREKDIRVLHIRVLAGERPFFDGTEIGQDGVIRYFSEGGILSTEQPDVDSMRIFLTDCMQDAKTVIFLTTAKEVGSPYDISCETLKSEFPQVYFLDSGQASGGLGLMLLEADEMIRQGKDASEISAALLRMRNQVNTSFIVSSTEYLERARLVRRSIHSLATALMLHPVLTVKNRGIAIERLYIGGRRTVRKKYLRKILLHREGIDPKRIFLCYVGMRFEEVEAIRRELFETGYFEEILIVKSSGAITASTGPGTFGIMYRKSEGRL